jgi:exportin-1
VCVLLQNVDVLKDQDAVKQLASILKTNVRACKALGHPYVLQVNIYLFAITEP